MQCSDKTKCLFGFAPSLIDWLVVLAIIHYKTVNLFGDIGTTDLQLWLVVSVYILFRFVFYCGLGANARRLSLCLMIALACIIETVLGISQVLTNYCYSGVSVCVGTFCNPGLLGGFLSACLCILVFMIKKEDNKYIRIVIWVAVACSVIVLPSTKSRASYIVIALCILYPLLKDSKYALLLRRKRLYVLIFLFVLVVLAYFWKKESANSRLFIYFISLFFLFSNPISGKGYGNFGGIYGSAQASFFHSQFPDFSDLIASNKYSTIISQIDCPLYAFNDFIQLGIEGGVIILALFLAIIIISLMVTINDKKWIFYGLLSVCIFASFSYPFHCLEFNILVSLLIAESQNSSLEYTHTYTQTLRIIALFVCFVLLIPYNHDVNGSKELKRKRNMIEVSNMSGDYYKTLSICESLGEDIKSDYSALFEYGLALNKVGYYAESDSILEMGKDRSSDPMFWNIMGNNSLALGDYRNAERCYKHAFYMLPNRLYPLYLLAKLYAEEGDTTQFLNMADDIKIFVPKVESKNTERLRKEIMELKDNY